MHTYIFYLLKYYISTTDKYLNINLITISLKSISLYNSKLY